MHTLHAVNPLRMGFIAGQCELRGRRVFDIGCGGGVLAESLTRLGARVVGVDLSEDLLAIARTHASEQGPVDKKIHMVPSISSGFFVVDCA